MSFYLLLFLTNYVFRFNTDYYASQWLVENECLQEIFGFRWCFAANSTTMRPPPITTTSSSSSWVQNDVNPAKLVSIVAPILTPKSLILTLRPTESDAPTAYIHKTVASTTESVLITLMSATSATYTAATSPAITTEASTSSFTTNPTSSEPALETTTTNSLSSSGLNKDGYQTTTTPPPTTIVMTFETLTELKPTTSTFTFATSLTPLSSSTKPGRMLKRQHDVLDPAVEVEPVLNEEGQQMYGLHDIPLYKNAGGKTILDTLVDYT